MNSKVQLIQVKHLGENKFEVVTSLKGSRRKDIIFREELVLNSMEAPMVYFTSESPDFSEIWGNSFEIRKQISQKVKEIANA